jgi:hypothetical protein
MVSHIPSWIPLWISSHAHFIGVCLISSSALEVTWESSLPCCSLGLQISCTSWKLLLMDTPIYSAPKEKTILLLSPVLVHFLFTGNPKPYSKTQWSSFQRLQLECTRPNLGNCLRQPQFCPLSPLSLYLAAHRPLSSVSVKISLIYQSIINVQIFLNFILIQQKSWLH